jgi:hypothetical protein
LSASRPWPLPRWRPRRWRWPGTELDSDRSNSQPWRPFRSNGGGESYSPSRQAGRGLFRRFRGIFLALHLFHHPHERSVDLITHSPEASGCENREPRFFKRSVAAAGIQVGRLLRAFSRRHSASLPHNGRAALLFYLSFRCRRQLGELGAQSP